MTGPSTPAPHRDGEGMVSEEMTERARRAYASGWRSDAIDERMRAALAAVAPDIAAQAKRECAEELRAMVEDAAAEPDDELLDAVDYDDRVMDVPPLLRLAESWSGPGRTPASVDQLAADVRTVLDQEVMHSHSRPGIWDADNRSGLAGTPCEECAARERLADWLSQLTSPTP